MLEVAAGRRGSSHDGRIPCPLESLSGAPHLCQNPYVKHETCTVNAHSHSKRALVMGRTGVCDRFADVVDAEVDLRRVDALRRR